MPDDRGAADLLGAFLQTTFECYDALDEDTLQAEDELVDAAVGRRYEEIVLAAFDPERVEPEDAPGPDTVWDEDDEPEHCGYRWRYESFYRPLRLRPMSVRVPRRTCARARGRASHRHGSRTTRAGPKSGDDGPGEPGSQPEAGAA